MKKAILKLNDGTTFEGFSFGADIPVSGEVVFNTAMVGYPELLTDPCCAGQIVVCTYPLIGNYGVPDSSQVQSNGLSTYMESDCIHAKALICTEYSNQYSHWNAHETLADWLRREHIPGITGVDTRALAMHLRDYGVMMGTIEIEGCQTPEMAEYDDINWVAQVSCSKVIRYNEGQRPKVILLDCGVAHSALRYLTARSVEIIRVPWDYDFNTLESDALLISDGPGNPVLCTQAIEHIHTYMQTHKPIVGIGLGLPLLALADGAKTYPLPFGHHSHNQPVQMVNTDHCMITTQNHGYAVEPTSLSKDWQIQFINMNDHSIEGIRHLSQPWVATQHGSFEDFIQLLNL